MELFFDNILSPAENCACDTLLIFCREMDIKERFDSKSRSLDVGDMGDSKERLEGSLLLIILWASSG